VGAVAVAGQVGLAGGLGFRSWLAARRRRSSARPNPGLRNTSGAAKPVCQHSPFGSPECCAQTISEAQASDYQQNEISQNPSSKVSLVDKTPDLVV